MPFVKHINTVFGRRQYGAAAKGEVSEHEIVVGHHHIGILQGIPSSMALYTGSASALSGAWNSSGYRGSTSPAPLPPR